MQLISDFVTADAVGRLIAALMGAIIGTTISWYLKRNRLRSAIRIEVSLLIKNATDIFTDENREDFKEKVKGANFLPVGMNRKFVVLDNLTDDIGYISKEAAENLILFVDSMGTLAEAIYLFNNNSFRSLNDDGKEEYVDIVFDLYKEAEQYYQKLLASL